MVPRKACRSPAVKGHLRCRMHGGKGSGALHGTSNGWKHGTRSATIVPSARDPKKQVIVFPI